MATCRVCTAPITWAVDENGERIPLDDHEQLNYGPKRYRITRDGNPPTVTALSEESPAQSFVDHRQLCQQPRAI